MKFTSGITVCVPTIPPRVTMYERALRSIGEAARSMPPGVPVQTVVALDIDKLGAAANRDRALRLVTTEWVAFLDDDDTMDPCHLRELYLAAREHGANYLWSRFRIGLPGGQTRPGPSPLGAGTFEQWNDDQPAQTTVTTFVRTELALDVGGFVQPGDHDFQKDGRCSKCATAVPSDSCTINGQRAGEDWLFTLACRKASGVFLHVPKVTWTWNHHASNTSGLPSRW
jgi:hypothetical protein